MRVKEPIRISGYCVNLPAVIGCVLFFHAVCLMAEPSIELEVQHSSNLKDWETVPVTSVMLGDDGKITLPAEGDLGYFRLLIETGEVDHEPAPEGFVRVPAGSFEMGDHWNETEALFDRSRPVHSVYVSEFLISEAPVTYGEWRAVYDWAVQNGYGFENAGVRGWQQESSNSEGGAFPETLNNNRHPVVWINWYDMVKWTNAKSEKEGLTPAYHLNEEKTEVYRAGEHDVLAEYVDWSASGYRLPTEAEWEKSARGGLVGKRWAWGDQEIDPGRANYGWNEGGTTPVGSYSSNGYGIYDPAGNVWEWCWDWFDEEWYGHPAATDADTRGPASGLARVGRGGSWVSDDMHNRVALRVAPLPGQASYNWGFRIVRGEVDVPSDPDDDDLEPPTYDPGDPPPQTP